MDANQPFRAVTHVASGALYGLDTATIPADSLRRAHADWYPTFPYQWVSWSNWLSAIDTQVRAVLAAGDSNISAFELWNEPDHTWNTTVAGSFDAGWTRTFDEVRSLDPGAPIQGPSISSFNGSFLTTFLTDAKASGGRD